MFDRRCECGGRGQSPNRTKTHPRQSKFDPQDVCVFTVCISVPPGPGESDDKCGSAATATAATKSGFVLLPEPRAKIVLRFPIWRYHIRSAIADYARQSQCGQKNQQFQVAKRREEVFRWYFVSSVYTFSSFHS